MTVSPELTTPASRRGIIRTHGPDRRLRPSCLRSRGLDVGEKGPGPRPEQGPTPYSPLTLAGRFGSFSCSFSCSEGVWPCFREHEKEHEQEWV
jgi:hypothetical protein